MVVAMMTTLLLLLSWWIPPTHAEFCFQVPDTRIVDSATQVENADKELCLSLGDQSITGSGFQYRNGEVTATYSGNATCVGQATLTNSGDETFIFSIDNCAEIAVHNLLLRGEEYWAFFTNLVSCLTRGQAWHPRYSCYLSTSAI